MAPRSPRGEENAEHGCVGLHGDLPVGLTTLRIGAAVKGNRDHQSNWDTTGGRKGNKNPK